MNPSTRHSLALLYFSLLSAIVSISSSNPLLASETRVAVASNFSETLKILARNFEIESGLKITIIPGSTGKLYAQIKNGAPFDAFFSADVKRAQLLEQEGLTIANSRFSYAFGKIILWSPEKNFVDSEADTLKNKTYQHLAIANPKLAPYGKAAQEVLQAIGLWNTLPGRLVQGENIAQTYQFVKSGNAQLGFIALSQVKKPGQTIPGSYWQVPHTLYKPVEQQAVQLKNNVTAEKFLAFVQSNAALKVIQSFGYDVLSGIDNAQ